VTPTKQPMTEEQVASFQERVREAAVELERRKASGTKLVWALRFSPLILATLIVISHVTVTVTFLVLGLVTFLASFYYASGSIFSRPKLRDRSWDRHVEDLQETLDDGVFVVIRVTSSGCFLIEPQDDESDEVYFDLGEQGATNFLFFVDMVRH
jgi:hypothetical protein